jgi:hypothetical protein
VELPEETIRTLQSTVEEYRYLLYVTIDLWNLSQSSTWPVITKEHW